MQQEIIHYSIPIFRKQNYTLSLKIIKKKTKRRKPKVLAKNPYLYLYKSLNL